MAVELYDFLADLVPSAPECLDDFLGEVWQLGDVLVAAGDGADLELSPVLGQLRVRRGGRDLVLDLVLTLQDAPGQRLLETLQLLLDELLSSDGSLLASLDASVDLVDVGRLVGGAVGRAQVHGALHRTQVLLVHIVDERLDRRLHARLSFLRHFVVYAALSFLKKPV